MPVRADVVAHLGVLSQPWRALALADGSLVAPDGAPLRWAIVAEDRVHDPTTSPTRRMRSVDGTPVVETTLRVPGGDVTVTAYGVADAGGALALEVQNGSGAAVAFACSRADVVASRASSALPPGAPLPPSWCTVPLGHGASVRVAVPTVSALSADALAALPAPAAVVRGWLRQLDGGLHVDLPEPDVAERLVRARAHACLAPAPDPVAEPARHLRRAGQLAALGFPEPVDVDALAAAVEALAGSLRRSTSTPWDDAAAFVGAGRALAALDEVRAAQDLRTLVARLPTAEPTPEQAPVDDEPYEAWLTRRLVVDDGRSLRVLPAFPPAWLGNALSAYEVPTHAGTVGFAVRWHGARPALLWDAPAGVTVTCPGLDRSWSSAEARGEALLADPR